MDMDLHMSEVSWLFLPQTPLPMPPGAAVMIPLSRSESTDSTSSSISSCSSNDGDVRPFVCPVAGCYRRFKRKCTLADHSKTHTGERPFACPVKTCGQSFTTSSNLSRHRRLHPWLKPDVCPEFGCGRAFSSEAKLQLHLKTHYRDSDERHQCPEDGCFKDFSSVGNLSRHRKRHHAGTKPHRPAINTGASSPASVAQFGHSCVDWSAPDTRYYSVGADSALASDEDLLDALQCLFETC